MVNHPCLNHKVFCIIYGRNFCSRVVCYIFRETDNVLNSNQVHNARNGVRSRDVFLSLICENVSTSDFVVHFSFCDERGIVPLVTSAVATVVTVTIINYFVLRGRYLDFDNFRVRVRTNENIIKVS